MLFHRYLMQEGHRNYFIVDMLAKSLCKVLILLSIQHAICITQCYTHGITLIVVSVPCARGFPDPTCIRPESNITVTFLILEEPEVY